MGTLTGLMHVVTGALAANQAAVSATAENISNLNTAGYSRRAVSWNEGDIITVGAGTSPGVRSTITAQRDRVLQRAVQNANEISAGSSTRLAALNQLQDLFKMDSSGNDAAGIGSAISGLFNAASSLAAAPGDRTALGTLFLAAQNFAETFNRAAAQISSQTGALNQQVSTSIEQVNALTKQVAALNRQLGEAPPDGARNILLDQRDSAITQLSKLIDVNTVSSEQDGLNLTLPDGTPLVSGATQLALSTSMVSGTVKIFAAPSTGSREVTSVIRGGSIGGSLQVRDSDAPAVMAQLDALAVAVAASVNAQNTLGTGASGLPGTDIFSGNAAATLTVVASDGTAFATTGADGVSGSNMRALGALQASGIVAGSTPTEAFSTLLSGLGGTISGAKIQSSADSAILTQTSTQLEATSGVSLDQEAANLAQYQRSYQAAAKVLSIVNELLAQAINLGQPTTVN